MLCALAFLSMPGIAAAADVARAPRNFSELVANLVGFLNVATALLLTLGVVVYFWGMTAGMGKLQEDADKRKAYFLWGIVALFVMVSIWGIVAILQRTLFGS